jgi:histidyl-tRNA synthetase
VAAVQHAALIARGLRRLGMSVELVEARLKRAMELANKLSARFTLIVGDNELAAGRYALKDMTTGEQRDVTRDEIATAIQPQIEIV